MTIQEQVATIVKTSLGLSKIHFDSSSPLLGAIPEFDSMAVVSIITALEDELDIVIDDDEMSADIFETFGSLCHFVDAKVAD